MASGYQITVGSKTISRMGLGAMRLTGQGIWGPPADRQNAIYLLRRAVDLGVNLIDTADSYGPHFNEEVICEALHPYDRHLIITTKGGMYRPGPGVWEHDARPQSLRKACEGSLRRLRADCVELYQLHAPDPKVPFEESVGALAELQREGKVNHVGLSNVSADQLRIAQATTQIVTIQNRYNILDRASQPLMDLCAREGILFLPWYPFSAGQHIHNLMIPQAVKNIDALARKHSATRTQIILAWLLQSSPVTIVIPGTSSVSHLEENIDAKCLDLTSGEIEQLDKLSC